MDGGLLIHRGKHSRGFVVLPNTTIWDLSLCGAGLLAYLLSQKPHTRTSADQIAARLGESRKRTREAMSELHAKRYVKTETRHEPDGRITSWIEVSDMPQLPANRTPPAGVRCRPAKTHVCAGHTGRHLLAPLVAVRSST